MEQLIRDNKIVVAVDYDGTIAQYGKLTKKGIRMIKKIRKYPVILVLWTCRTGKMLNEALQEIKQANIQFDYINDTDGIRNEGRKINADIYIDDKNPCGVQWHRAIKRIKREIRMEQNGSRERQFNKECNGGIHNDSK